MYTVVVKAGGTCCIMMIIGDWKRRHIYNAREGIGRPSQQKKEIERKHPSQQFALPFAKKKIALPSIIHNSSVDMSPSPSHAALSII
jgi:hypothetical protein